MKRKKEFDKTQRIYDYACNKIRLEFQKGWLYMELREQLLFKLKDVNLSTYTKGLINDFFNEKIEELQLIQQKLDQADKE